MASRYDNNYVGVGEMLRASWMKTAMELRANAVKAAAEAIAPVQSGRYKASFKVSSGTDGVRAYGRVTNTAPYAMFVEFGSARVRRHRTLGKSLHAAGGDVHAKP